MFKIITLLFLLHFLFSSALHEIANNNEAQNIEPKAKRNSYQFPNKSFDKSGEIEPSLCSRRKNSVDDVESPSPVVGLELSKFMNPESESLIYRSPFKQDPSDEVYDNKYPHQFDDQSEKIFYNRKNDDSDKNPKLGLLNDSRFKFSTASPSKRNSPNVKENFNEALDRPSNLPLTNQNYIPSQGEPKQSRDYNYDPNHNKIQYTPHKSESENENALTASSRQNEVKSFMQSEPELVEDCPLFPKGTRRANNDEKFNHDDVPSRSEDDLKNDETEQPRRNYPPRRINAKFPSSQLPDPAIERTMAVPPAGVSLLEHNRVCYACTSASNPTCMFPDRTTTFKYCLKGRDSCVTKTYQNGKNKDSMILIRDCGTCDDKDVQGYQYKSCKVCQTDLCNDDLSNSAYSAQSQSLLFTLFMIFLIKYTF